MDDLIGDNNQYIEDVINGNNAYLGASDLTTTFDAQFSQDSPSIDTCQMVKCQTTNPTNRPTFSPSHIPTISSTVTPTIFPTFIPTNIPTGIHR